MTRYVGRDRITIYQDTSKDGTLEPVFTETVVTNLPCEIANVSGQEKYRGRQLEPVVDYVIETRHRTDVTHLMRVTVTAGLFTGETMYVKAVKPMQFLRGRPPMLWIMCNQVPV